MSHPPPPFIFTKYSVLKKLFITYYTSHPCLYTRVQLKKKLAKNILYVYNIYNIQRKFYITTVQEKLKKKRNKIYYITLTVGSASKLRVINSASNSPPSNIAIEATLPPKMDPAAANILLSITSPI